MQPSPSMSQKYRLSGGPQVDRDMRWILSDSELLKQPQQREDLDFDRHSERKVRCPTQLAGALCVMRGGRRTRTR